MSDDLIGRADSLMRRGRTFVAGRVAPAGLASDHSLWKSNQALPFGVYQE